MQMESSILLVITKISYKYKLYIVKHNSINDFIKVYFLHCSVQPHVLGLVMSPRPKCVVTEGQQTSDYFHRPMLHRHKKPLHQ